MQQFFIEGSAQEKIILSDKQVFQILNVLRYKVGSQFIVVDTFNTACLVKVISTEPFLVDKVEYIERKSNATKVNLMACLIKKDKWEWLLQKACEFGANEITPIISERCVVKLDDRLDGKYKRWESILKEACEQTRVSYITKLNNPVKLKNLKLQNGVNIVAYESEDNLQLVDFLMNNNYSEINILIGPEGGFSEHEIEYLANIGFVVTSLGERIYRAESAALYCLSTIDNVSRLKK